MGQPEVHPRTLSEALSYGQDVVLRAHEQLVRLPRTTAETRRAPTTLQEALTVVQQHEEEKRKALARRDERGKDRTPPVEQQQFPGARVGAGIEGSAYWLFIEVRPELVRKWAKPVLCPSADARPFAATGLLSGRDHGGLANAAADQRARLR